LKLDTMEQPIAQIKTELLSKLMREWEEALKAYLRKNLSEIGHKFVSDDEFMEFAKERITKVASVYHPGEYILFLDFVNLDNPGIEIGSYDTSFSIKNSGYSFTATIGKS